ncbi:MAG: F0F1 ATP synthase subunit A, partial [Calditrichaeota bacterium]|nr:F0F1 ATP synthase subunit A [Calditrichota bacterium]MCB0316343.1 F0F1 ATP synthase subunit A [Calditrichota bacterium]
MSLAILRDSGGEEHSEGGLGGYILHHLQDSNAWLGSHLPHFEPVTLFGISIDFSITTHVLMLWIASLILIVAFWLSFRKPKAVPTGLAGVLESIVLFIRDEIAVPNIGEKLGKKLTPFLATIFFF